MIAIDRVSELSALDYERRYRMSRPVVIEGGARSLPAFAAWTMDALRARVGAAQVDAFRYRGSRGDYDDSTPEPTTLAAFIDALLAGDTAYLFPSATSVFARNEQRPERHVGWAARVNPGLAPLAADFAPPGFVRPDDYVLAALILGSAQNATDLHYDLGGESKLLIQIAGRKRIQLVSPYAASRLQLHPAFAATDGAGPGPATPRRRNRSRGEIDPACPELRDHVHETVLHPGDIIYWPAFWSHDVANLDTPTFAASVFLDEIRVDPLFARHMLGHTFASLVQLIHRHLDGQPLRTEELADLDVSFKDLPFVGLLDLFGDLEAFLLSSACADLRGLWEWNGALPAIRSPDQANQAR